MDHKLLYNGKIELILGPMFSGKTTELIRRIKTFQISNRTCLVIKHLKDSRPDNLCSHDLQILDAIATLCLYELYNMSLLYNVIAIDEGQFFPDIVNFSEEMANIGKIVIISALDGTYLRNPFYNILKLIPLAEHVVKFHAICKNCFKKASFTKRTSNEVELFIVGGADKYSPMCRTCYFDESLII